MIYCVWYPSGGFGHFVNAVLSLHGSNFVRPTNSLNFSNTGDSHSLELSAPKYFHDQSYNYDFLPDVNYSVLVDNGINNEGTKFLKSFSTAKIIKMCYDDYSWPVVARTMIDKAMKSSIEHELDIDKWSTDESWARREKYFLFLRDHSLRFAWRPDSIADVKIDVSMLTNYTQFKSAIETGGIDLAEFKDLWCSWADHNSQYYVPVQTASQVIDQIKNNKTVDLSMIDDVWTQAVIYYYIWLEFNVEIPHNDYSNFFKSTTELRKLLYV